MAGRQRAASMVRHTPQLLLLADSAAAMHLVTANLERFVGAEDARW